jgi:hypothetical protein
MGIRGEVYSTKVQLDNRTYFFNVKENRTGDLYLNIVESKNKDGGGFERASVIVFEEDAQAFLKGFDDAVRVLEKNAREKRKAARPPVKRVVRTGPAKPDPAKSGPAKPGHAKLGPKTDFKPGGAGQARPDRKKPGPRLKVKVKRSERPE